MYSVESFRAALHALAELGSSEHVREIRAFNSVAFHAVESHQGRRARKWSRTLSSFCDRTFIMRLGSIDRHEPEFAAKTHGIIARFLQEHAAR